MDCCFKKFYPGTRYSHSIHRWHYVHDPLSLIKERIRGPNLEFEHLERELANSSVWPPLGKNNDVKVGKSAIGKHMSTWLFVFKNSVFLFVDLIEPNRKS